MKSHFYVANISQTNRGGLHYPLARRAANARALKIGRKVLQQIGLLKTSVVTHRHNISTTTLTTRVRSAAGRAHV